MTTTIHVLLVLWSYFFFVPCSLVLCTKCWRDCRPRGSTPGKRNMDRFHLWVPGTVSLSHTHTIPTGCELRIKTSLQCPEHCYSILYLTSYNFAFEEIAFFFTSTTRTAKICCVVHVSLCSVTLASTAPSGKALGLGRCATVLQELSATSSCWSAYESDAQLICAVLCIISKRKKQYKRQRVDE